MSQFEPDYDVEQELRAALHDRAEAIHPTHRWTTIERAVSGAPTTRRWPTMLLAAAAVLAVAVAVLVARPGPAPTHPAAPTPRLSASTPDADRIRPDVRLPIFSIANNAAGRADKGLGLVSVEPQVIEIRVRTLPTTEVPTTSRTWPSTNSWRRRAPWSASTTCRSGSSCRKG